MLKRMQSDYQLAIISLFGACVVLGVLPSAVYRFVSGAHRVAALDLAITIGIVLAGVAAWRTGRTRVPGFFMAAITNVGAVLSALMQGDAGLLWIYAVLVSNFFLLPRRLAAALAVAEIAGLAIHGGAFDGPSHMASFVASSLLVGTLGLIIAHWTNHQREELEQLATHDALTGLCNRRAMARDLQRAVLASERSGAPVGIAIVDIDHFKRVNDRHGHAAGDAVLVAFAGLLQASVRHLDDVYRLGGEEFLLLLPGAGVGELTTITEHLRAGIESRLQSPDGGMTASLGAAALRAGEDVRGWLTRADRALYRAKGLGRNRACVDGEASNGWIDVEQQVVPGIGA